MPGISLEGVLPSYGRSRKAFFSAPVAAGIAAFLSLLGLTLVWSTLQLLWGLWTTDALKSIGMVVPVVSFFLVLRVWRLLGWEMDGSWWGLAVLVATALVVRLRDQSLMVLQLGPAWNLYFPPHGLVMLAYGLGVCLLFGGWKLVKASRFPLFFLLLVDPIPHFFNLYVDLPLQRVSAHVARSFAHSLGQPLTPDHLRLMFTPEFGMFIAPGCNGIRGAVTMGLIALVVGYLYNFRWRAHALVVLGSVLLGYVFNFVRLCALVIFYVIALHFPKLQSHAENADYVIGAALFFGAVFLLYTAIHRLQERRASEHDFSDSGPATRALQSLSPLRQKTFSTHALAMAILAMLGVASVIQQWRSALPSAELRADETAPGRFPAQAGSYNLVRTWNENLIGGALLFHWAEYAPADGGTHVSVGVSPVLGSHDTLICHTARGEDPLWTGQQALKTAGDIVSFNTSFYNDGATEYLEATTLCNGATCGEYAANSDRRIGFVFSRPHPAALLSQNPDRPIPILLKVDSLDTTLPVDVARQSLSSDLSSFLSGIDLHALTQPYRRH